MQSLQHILLSNAAGVAVLAAAVWLLCRVVRSPAVCRALWVIVLLKLLTPPLVAIPIDRWLVHRPPVETYAPAAPQFDAQPNLPEVQFDPAPGSRNAPPPALAPTWRQRALAALPVVWTAGTLLLLAVGAVRVVVLVRLLDKAPPAPDAVQHLAASVASRLGIAKTPRVCFVPGVVCPALWAFSARPRVIIPLTLWDRLNEPERRTLLAHELAHLRRGDHWVRLLEFVSAVVYWWHPAVWVARRQINNYEEQCCDAWVLWAMPASAHTYGSALLEAVDFVSSARPMRPALSAGLGEFRHLKRRLLMIKQGTVSRALSRTSLAAVLGAAAVVLPFTPGIAQDAAPRALPGSPPGAGAENAPSTDPQLAEARARVQRLQRELAEARSRLAVLERGSGSATPGAAMSGTVYVGPEGAYVGRIVSPPTPAPGAPSAGTMSGFGGGGVIMTAPAPAGTPSQASITVVPRAGVGTAAAAGSSMSMPGTMGYASGGGRAEGTARSSSSAPADAERRLQGLENSIRQLMDQMKELRQMQERQLQNPNRSPEGGARGS